MRARIPEDCDRLFGELVNAGNLDALVDLYEPGASLLQPDGSAAVGHAAIRAALGELLGSKPRIQMKTARMGATRRPIRLSSASTRRSSPRAIWPAWM